MPALTAGTSNQGLSCYCKKEYATILKNVISVASNGAAGTMFYQPNDFTVLQDAYAIEFKGKVLSSKEYLYFLIFLQKSASGRFDWSNKAYWEKVKDLDFYIPRIGDNVAFEYMERYIEELEAYLKATGLKDYELTKEEEDALAKFDDFSRQGEVAKEFNLEKLFGSATRGKRLKSADRYDGDLPFVTAGEADMGISAFISNDVEIFKENTVTIDMFGSAKYRNYRYGADDHVAVVHTENLSKHAAIYVTTAIHKVANAGRFSYARNFYAKDADELSILLPISNGEIDYDFMGNFIRAIEKLVIKDVVLWADKKIEATKSVVNR